jgi:hypothetical protein
MASRLRAAACLVFAGLLPGAVALAQSAAPAAAAPGGDGTSAASAAPSSSATPYPATGYGWTEVKPRATKGRSRRSAALPPGDHDFAVPGFEMLGDGSTRLFVQLAKPVTYVAKPGRGSITYVLQGAHVSRWNNTNPLVTVHFNTPVTEARLVPHGRDLWFVIDLRAQVQPTASMDATKAGGAILHLDFAKGDYLPQSATTSQPAPSSSAPAAAASSG